MQVVVFKALNSCCWSKALMLLVETCVAHTTLPSTHPFPHSSPAFAPPPLPLFSLPPPALYWFDPLPLPPPVCVQPLPDLTGWQYGGRAQLGNTVTDVWQLGYRQGEKTSSYRFFISVRGRGVLRGGV